MRALSKLLGKKQAVANPMAGLTVEEAFPEENWGSHFSGSFQNDIDSGYEAALGPGPAPAMENEDDPFTEEDRAWVSSQAGTPVDEAALLAHVAEGPGSEWAALRMRLHAEPRSADAHAAVRRAICVRGDRIDFYQELASTYPNEAYHRLSLARAYRSVGLGQDAIPHFQHYLRSRLDAEALEELAEVYSSVGDRYLAESSRQIAQSIRSKGGTCSSS